MGNTAKIRHRRRRRKTRSSPILLAAGTYSDLEIDERAKVVRIKPTGDVVITGFKSSARTSVQSNGGTKR